MSRMNMMWGIPGLIIGIRILIETGMRGLIRDTLEIGVVCIVDRNARASTILMEVLTCGM